MSVGKKYDPELQARALRMVVARIARIGVDSKERLGLHRRVVERTMAWVLAYRKLATRHDRTTATITSLTTLAIAVTGMHKLIAAQI